MANQVAVAPAQSAVASVVTELFNSSEIETIEQLGRDYWVAEDAKAKAERKLSQCDTALFDTVKGLEYRQFMQVRGHFVTGCRDKGAPSDEAACKTWERAINRLITSCAFKRPTSDEKDAKRMSEKAAKLKAELDAKSTLELEARKTELLEKGDTKSLREAQSISKALDERMKPEIDKAKASAAALADKITKRVKELKASATPDAIELLIKLAQVAG